MPPVRRASLCTEDPVYVPGVSLLRDRCIYTWANICGSTQTGSCIANDVRRPTAREYRSHADYTSCIRISDIQDEGKERLPLTFTNCVLRSVVRHFYFCHLLINFFTNCYFFPRHVFTPEKLYDFIYCFKFQKNAQVYIYILKILKIKFTKKKTPTHWSLIE